MGPYSDNWLTGGGSQYQILVHGVWLSTVFWKHKTSL